MDAYDIRRSHDIKGDGRRTATAILNGRPPSSKDIAASPGLACLIVVLRRVYGLLLHHPGALPFLDWVKSSEEVNPILRVAWNAFGDEPDEVEQATISMNNMAEELSSMGFSPNESFYTLCESSLMKNTFWSHPGIRVVRPPTQSNIGNQDVVGSYLHADLLEFHPAQAPGQTLQAFANGFLGATAARPPIIRILYHSDSKQPIDFNGLRSFIPPVSSHDARLSFAGRDKEYVVLAIVRLNDTNNKNDYVRTYSIYGPNIIAEYEPPSFMAHRWSVKDAPVKYILIYGLHEQWPVDLTEFASLPEIATHPVSQENFSFHRLVDDSLRDTMLALRTPETDTNSNGDPQQSLPEYKDHRVNSHGLYTPKVAWDVKENSPGYGSDRPFME